MLGPSGKAIVFITAYRPVSNSKNGGMLTAMAQHKRVQGQNSDPREAILSDLLKLIVKIHQKNHCVVLGIDTNEKFMQDGTPPDNVISKFCSDAGLVDTIHENNGQCPIPSCNKSFSTPIDFMLCSPALLPFI